MTSHRNHGVRGGMLLAAAVLWLSNCAKEEPAESGGHGAYGAEAGKSGASAGGATVGSGGAGAPNANGGEAATAANSAGGGAGAPNANGGEAGTASNSAGGGAGASNANGGEAGASPTAGEGGAPTDRCQPPLGDGTCMAELLPVMGQLVDEDAECVSDQFVFVCALGSTAETVCLLDTDNERAYLASGGGCRPDGDHWVECPDALYERAVSFPVCD